MHDTDASWQSLKTDFFACTCRQKISCCLRKEVKLRRLFRALKRPSSPSFMAGNWLRCNNPSQWSPLCTRCLCIFLYWWYFPGTETPAEKKGQANNHQWFSYQVPNRFGFWFQWQRTDAPAGVTLTNLKKAWRNWETLGRRQGLWSTWVPHKKKKRKEILETECRMPKTRTPITAQLVRR